MQSKVKNQFFTGENFAEFSFADNEYLFTFTEFIFADLGEKVPQTFLPQTTSSLWLKSYKQFCFI